MFLIESTAALAIGCLLDALIGDPPGMPHIVRAMGKMTAALERFLRRRLPAGPAGERAGGRWLVLLMTLFWLGIPGLILWTAYRLWPVAGLLLESLLCFQLLACRNLADESCNVLRSLEQGGLAAGRFAVGRIVGRDTAELDEAGVIRATVETVAENTSDGVVAPLFFLLLGGAPVGCLYKAVNTMDSMVGYRNAKYLNFGRAAARLDDGFNFLPSRLAALLMIAVAGGADFRRRQAWQIFRRDRRNHASPNSAQTESVAAGALGLRLGGPSRYGGLLVDKPTIGDDERPIERADILRVNRLMIRASLLMAVLVLGIRLALFALLGGWAR